MNLDVMLILFQIVVLIFAFSVHESAHAYAAYRLGDPTAYMLGRVTLNPIKHIDPIGSGILPPPPPVFRLPARRPDRLHARPRHAQPHQAHRPHRLGHPPATRRVLRLWHPRLG